MTRLVSNERGYNILHNEGHIFTSFPNLGLAMEISVQTSKSDFLFIGTHGIGTHGIERYSKSRFTFELLYEHILYTFSKLRGARIT